jgi:hypothetical protein
VLQNYITFIGVSSSGLMIINAPLSCDNTFPVKWGEDFDLALHQSAVDKELELGFYIVQYG